MTKKTKVVLCRFDPTYLARLEDLRRCIQPNGAGMATATEGIRYTVRCTAAMVAANEDSTTA